MPFFLILPFAPAVATAVTNTGISIGAALGIGFGSATVGGVSATGLWFWWRSFFNSSKKHQTSLETQNKMTNERIETAQSTIDSLSSNVARAVGTFSDAALATTVSIDQLHQASEQISATGNHIADSTLLIQRTLQQLDEDVPLFNQIATETHTNALKTVAAVNELHDLLNETKLELVQTHHEIQGLNTTVRKQNSTIAHLGNVVIEQKKTIAILSEEKGILSERARQSAYSCRFLKQELRHARQVLAEREVSQLISRDKI